MKRILIAAVLSLAIHGLLLGTEFGGHERKSIGSPRVHVMAMRLTCIKPQGEKSATRGLDLRKPAGKKITKRKSEADHRILRPKPRKKPLKPERSVHSFTKPERKIKALKEAPDIKHELKPEAVPVAEKPETVKESAERLAPEAVAGSGGFSSVPGAAFGDAPSMGGQPGGGLPGGSGLQEVRPLYRVNPPPKYPRVARRRGNQGTVVVEVLVDESGRVGDLRMIKSSGYNNLDKAAITAVKKWTFEPGSKNGRRVAMWVRVPVRFQLD